MSSCWPQKYDNYISEDYSLTIPLPQTPYPPPPLFTVAPIIVLIFYNFTHKSSSDVTGNWVNIVLFKNHIIYALTAYIVIIIYIGNLYFYLIGFCEGYIVVLVVFVIYYTTTGKL